MKKGYWIAGIIALVLILDQSLKIYIKTHFCTNEEVLMFGQKWARLHFIENEGMAFGITFDWPYGKLLLSLFRIVMVAGLIWYIRMLLSIKAPFGFAVSVGLITAGAIGNIIDSAFYGLIFSASPVHTCEVAGFVPFGQGYGSFLHGEVVDMLYFPMFRINLPEWLGGGDFLFFSSIFNLADASITTGVLSILLFQRKFFKKELESKADHAAAEASEASLLAEQEFLSEKAELPSDRTPESPEPDNTGEPKRDEP